MRALAAYGTGVHNRTIQLHDPRQVDEALSGTFA
jgi:hypothetical protein